MLGPDVKMWKFNLCHSSLETQDLLLTKLRTMYPAQAVRQVILAVDGLVAGSDVAEVAGLLHAVWRGQRLEGEEAVVAVHLRWYI